MKSYPLVSSFVEPIVSPLVHDITDISDRAIDEHVFTTTWTPQFRGDGFGTIPDFHAAVGDTIEIEAMVSALSASRYSMLIDDEVSSTSFFGIEGNVWVVSRYTFTIDGAAPVAHVPLGKRLKIVLTSTDANNIVREIGSFLKSYPWIGQIYSIRLNHNSTTPPTSLLIDFTKKQVTAPSDTDLIIQDDNSSTKHTTNIIKWGNPYNGSWNNTSLGSPKSNVMKLVSDKPIGLLDGQVARINYAGKTFFATSNHPDYGIVFSDHLFICDQYGRAEGSINTYTPTTCEWQIETTQLINNSDYKLQFADDAPSIIVGSNNIVFNNNGMVGTAFTTEKISPLLYRGAKVRMSFTIDGSISGDSIRINAYGFGATDKLVINELAVDKDYVIEFEMGDGSKNWGSDELKIEFEIAPVGVLAHYTITNISITVDPAFDCVLKGFSSPVWVKTES